MSPLALGVDGGNTKTLAIVTDLEGHVVGTGRSGCGDIYATTPEPALAELDAAITCALSEADAAPGDVVSAGFSLAGADWPEDFEFLEAQMARHLPPSTAIVVVNDAMGALRAGAVDGVAVVCGTGSAIGARLGDASWHASFWGEGSGALAIGRAALRSIVRSELGMDPPSGLTDAALETFGLSTVDELLHVATRRGAPRALLADLAPIVLDAADRNDEVAFRLITSAGRTLGEYARVAAHQVGLVDGSFPLVLAGGVFRHASALLRSEISSALPGAPVVEAPFEPVAGALLLALDRLGKRIDMDVLRMTIPSAGSFAMAAGAR
jgi:N-acetylglucosamine kinase-like BadF-type ATPase